jgi:hypothetical protein
MPLAGFSSLKGRVETVPREGGGSGGVEMAASRRARKTWPASPFRDTRSSFASLIPSGKDRAATVMPTAPSFSFNASVPFLPASSLSSARITRLTPSRFSRSRWSGVKPFTP